MKFTILVVLVILSLGASAHLPNGIESDSGIRGIPYQEYEAKLRKLVAKFPRAATLIHLGKSTQGRNLLGVLIRNPLEGTPKKMIMITGATHGNEYLNIADRLIPAFLNKSNQKFQSYFSRGHAVFLVPIFNPDGYERRRRGNANGVDLNRDFSNPLIRLKGFTQPETRAVGSFLEKLGRSYGTELSLVVDYHCCDGSILYPLSYTKKPLPSKDLKAHQRIALLMKKHFPGYRYGTTGDLLGYTPRGTSKDYYYMRYNALAFTFEGVYRREHKKLASHILWWSDIVDLF